MNKKAQTWSVDLVLGVVIFLLVVVIIYSLIASRPARENQLRDDADRIYVNLAGEKGDSQGDIPTIIDGNTISEAELEKLYSQDYQTLKEKLGITSDFCILVITDDNALVDFNGNSTIGNGKDIVIGETMYCGERS